MPRSFTWRGLVWSGIACAVLVLPPPLGAQPLRFVRESLQFWLADDGFRFTGTYVFDNPGETPVDTPIYYPFVLGGYPPDSVRIVEGSSGTAVPIVPGQSGLSFVATVAPRSTQSYFISFVQRCPKRSLEYILKTTASWGHPLDRATFTIRVPGNLAVTFISLKPETISSMHGVTTYIVKRENFMPEGNLLLRWGRKRQ